MKLADLARDAIGLIGAGSFTAGIALISLPAALIVAGLMIMVGAWLSARAS
jgi:hypothetical protein